MDAKSQKLKIELENTVIIDYMKDGVQERPTAGHSSIEIEYGKRMEQISIMKRDKFENFRALYARSVIERQRGDRKRICEIETELNQRVVMALSPIAFLLLGLPMAIRTSRRETSVGLFMSVLLAGIYFLTTDFSTTIKQPLIKPPDRIGFSSKRIEPSFLK